MINVQTTNSRRADGPDVTPVPHIAARHRADHQNRNQAASSSGDLQSELLLTVDELSRKLKVSPKTIWRWRKKGLAAEWMTRGGRRQLGFRETAVRRFARQNPQRVRRGARFRPMSDEERDEILARIRTLAAEGLPHRKIVKQLAEETGRHVGTIRAAIKRHDQQQPNDALIGETSGQLSGHQRKAIYREYRSGVSPDELARRYDRSVATIHRVVGKLRAERIMQLPLDYVGSAAFTRRGAEEKILAPLPEPEHTPRKARRPTDLPAYLASLYDVPLLTRDQEAHLFRQFNFAKYRADKLRKKLDPARPQSRLMDEIEQLYETAVATKKQLIRANLRLVVSIAKKYISAGDQLFELISDGNVSLMKAVERFDYSLGNKFSTYATWAIKNNFARAYSVRQRDQDRFRTSQDELLAIEPEQRINPYFEEVAQQSRESQVGEVLRSLEPRERDVISRRFGLDYNTEPMTLKEVGQELGVSKERIRQIEVRALDKLRAAAELANIESPAA